MKISHSSLKRPSKRSFQRWITSSRGVTASLCAGVAGLVGLAFVLPSSAQQNNDKQGGKQGATTAKSHYVSPPGYIQGTVTGDKGPEAGVWVVAITHELGTQMIKTVVTNDQGKFVIPELPAVNYKVFVRGYGIEDSAMTDARPSMTAQLALKVTSAKSPADAAKVYPGNYWMQMLEPPARSSFPIGTGAPQQSLEAWVHNFKSSCNFCHQLGNPITRTLDHVFKAKPELKTSKEAWDYRITTGVRGSGMSGAANQLGRDVALNMFSSWTDRIAKGETPKVKPTRPQ